MRATLTTNIVGLAVILTVVAALGGCSIATREEAVASLSEPGAVQGAEEWSAKGLAGQVDDGWLAGFKAPGLIAIVEEALANNPGLTISEAQIEKANALARQAGAANKPSVGIGGDYLTDTDDELYGANLTVSWEADIWGRVRSQQAGAQELAAAIAYDYKYVRQSLAAATAKAWFTTVASKLQHQNAVEAVEILEKSLEIIAAKERIGQVSMSDVHLSKGNVAQAKDAERKAMATLENAQRALELLLGRYPSAMIETADRLVAVPPPIPTGLPSQILERRPDLKSAQRQVAAAFYRQESAELLRLPRFTLTAAVGENNITDTVTSLGAGIFAPLYAGGAIEAEIEAATAVQKQTIANYAQKALLAFQETEAALSGEQYLEQREKYLTTVLEENKRAYDISNTQFEVGTIDFLDVLTVQDKWLSARIARLDIALQRLLNRVALHQALGGSFEEVEEEGKEEGK